MTYLYSDVTGSHHQVEAEALYKIELVHIGRTDSFEW